VRGSQGFDQVDKSGFKCRRQGNAGEDRRCEVAVDQELRLLRRVRDRCVELRRIDLCPRRRERVTVVLNIEQDYLRFRQIVRGKIKEDLKKYISQGELIGKKGKDYVSIPIPQIEM